MPRRAYRWLATHPFVTTVLLVVALVAPGYLRLENQQSQVEAQQEKIVDLVFTACQERNGTQAVQRARFHRVFDEIAQAGPEAKAFAERLRSLIGEASDEDRDCTQDGVLTKADYTYPPQGTPIGEPFSEQDG